MDDNRIQIENCKSQIEDLATSLKGKTISEQYEIRQQIGYLNNEILRLEQEDEDLLESEYVEQMADRFGGR